VMVGLLTHLPTNRIARPRMHPHTDGLPARSGLVRRPD
jgi:hypothetical protein